ncbi:BspA family leucine-rich repeat surface protein [Flavobacterium rhizosphaerae]|uniref:BspA family leucine-rich repeat surface protein n=1 Tax=Flavobacterium rhizosphaerae TaxID=3163298 RepID=A0ABW8YYR3_9FLAO
MKKFYFYCIALFASYYVNAQEPFITTWQVEADDLTIIVPVDGTNNDFTINFGDGVILNNQTGQVSHEYVSPGTYTVTISGDFNKFNFYSGSDKIMTIEQWGDVEWSSMNSAFSNCPNLTITAVDSPDLSQVTDMSYMFAGCSSLNQSINNWDVSNVVNMESLFASATEFNQPLNNWNISNVTNIKNIFTQTAFNQPLDAWDVSNVTTMQNAFAIAMSFNQPLNNWDVSSVTNMDGMFVYASSFNQPLDNWDVSNVTTMSDMFAHADVFNQNINSWDLSSLTLMDSMFYKAYAFNQPLDSWDVSNVTSMFNVFNYASSFNQPLNSWDVSNVTAMPSMFYQAYSFNQPLDNWDVSNVTNMTGMFRNAQDFNQDLSGWNFNTNVDFGYGSSQAFLGYSGLDTDNYDALLYRFAQLGLQNKYLGANNLKYCDAGVRNYLINQLNWNISGDGLSAQCIGNTISGNVRFDENADGCNADDMIIDNILVAANNGTFTYSTLSSLEGEFNINLFEDTYTVQLLNIPSYFTASPASQNVTFSGSGNIEQLDFCLTANQAVEDINVIIIPVTEARPGFEAIYQLVVENIGTQTVSGVSVNLVYDETAQSFINADQIPATNTAGQLGFTIATLQPFESRVINLVMQTFTPPTVNGGDILNFTATVTPNTNDYTPDDNSFEFNQVIVNAFDPNDKTVVQGDAITMDQATGYLDYIVRFQNTGTASAITVRIEDVLDEKLDWTTFSPVSASHDYHVEISENNHVEFIFNDINLPAESDDEPGSHGFIAFKVKPVTSIAVGDIIEGTAAIYFDYNEPIITNTVNTTVIENTNSIKDFNLKSKLAVYPNPATDLIKIQASQGVAVESVKIFNIQGSELFSFSIDADTINVKNIAVGIYVLSVTTNQGTANFRVIKN